MKYEKRESNTIKKVKNTKNSQPNNPLHGVRLDAILNSLIDAYGWEELGRRIKINCFTNNPTLNSSLKFLRKTPWAREKVEDLYLKSIEKDKK